MEALKSSSSLKRIFVDRTCRRSGASLESIAFFKTSTRLASSPKLDSGFSVAGRSILLQHKLIHSITRSSPVLVDFEADTETLDTKDNLVQTLQTDVKIIDTEDNLVQERNQTKFVRVKFQLQRQCQFGQKFLLIGEDPMLGFWDPANGIPLDWSNGHVWSVELDIPVGKTIQYKFILKKGVTGEIEWQPDPDRILCTWETEKTIVVSEDWGNAVLQQITEEEALDDLAERSIFQTEEPMLIPTDELMTNLTMESVLGEGIVESNGRAVTDDNLGSMEDEEILMVNEGVPVLVPGLATTPESGMDEDFPKEISNGIVPGTSAEADEASDYHKPELCEKQEYEPSNENSPHEEKIIMTFDAVPEEKLPDDEIGETLADGPKENSRWTEEPARVILKNDFHWGRKTLQKFFLILGFFS